MRARYALLLLALLAFAPRANAKTGYTCSLSSASEVPANASTATGSATVILDNTQTMLDISVTFSGLANTYTASHIHGPAPVGMNAGVKWGFVGVPAGWVFNGTSTAGTLSHFQVTGLTATDVANLNNGLMYVNIHSVSFPGGEIRGQLGMNATPTFNGTWGRIKQLYH